MTGPVQRQGVSRAAARNLSRYCIPRISPSSLITRAGISLGARRCCSNSPELSSSWRASATALTCRASSTSSPGKVRPATDRSPPARGTHLHLASRTARFARQYDGATLAARRSRSAPARRPIPHQRASKLPAPSEPRTRRVGVWAADSLPSRTAALSSEGPGCRASVRCPKTAHRRRSAH